MLRPIPALMFVFIGCTGEVGSGPGGIDPGQVDAAGPAGDPLDTEPDPLSAANGIKSGAAQLAVLCARGNGDAVSKAFCGATPPTITSISDLQLLLGLDFKAGQTGNAKNGNPGTHQAVSILWA